VSGGVCGKSVWLGRFSNRLKECLTVSSLFPGGFQMSKHTIPLECLVFPSPRRGGSVRGVRNRKVELSSEGGNSPN